jgi:hypothetical protein
MKKLAFIFVLVPLVCGCSKKTVTNTVYQSKLVLASINYSLWPSPPGQFWGEVDFYSDPAPDPGRCSVQIKAGSTQLQFSDPYYIPGGISYYGTDSLPYSGTPCSLSVATNLGSSQGVVSIPGSYSLVSTPAQYDTVPWGDVDVSWTSAQNASWYELDVSYGAWMGGIYLGNADTVLIATGTSMRIPRVFFSKYMSASYAWVYFTLGAHDGALKTPGAAGNLTGDIKGFYYSTFVDTSATRSFYMGTPKGLQGAVPPPQISEEKRRQAILRAFGV